MWKIVALARAAVAAAIAPGVTTKQLDRIAEKVIREQGASPSFKGYGGFPASICTSVNSVLVHGIPDQTVLKDGDLISIDIGACYKGYHGDAAWTFSVGRVSEDAVRLMEVTRQSLFIGLKQAKPGNRLSDISHAIGSFVEAHGYSVPIDYTGHRQNTNIFVFLFGIFIIFGFASNASIRQSADKLASAPGFFLIFNVVQAFRLSKIQIKFAFARSLFVSLTSS